MTELAALREENERLRGQCIDCLQCVLDNDISGAAKELRRALNLVNRFRCESCGRETIRIMFGVPCECGGNYESVVTVDRAASGGEGE